MTQPNFVFILADDQGSWAMRCAGNAEIHTPNLDRLAASGARFTNFFCASPVCSPARASILTGRIPSQHGIHDWIRKGNLNARRAGLNGDDDREIDYLASLRGYTHHLAQNGYVCGISGKWHLGDDVITEGGLRFLATRARQTTIPPLCALHRAAFTLGARAASRRTCTTRRSKCPCSCRAPATRRPAWCAMTCSATMT